MGGVSEGSEVGLELEPEKPSENPRPPLTRLDPAWLDAIAKSVAIFSFLTYAVGLLIINFYLWKYGTFELEPLRPEYIVTGIVWLLLTVCGFYLLVETKVFALLVYKHLRDRGSKGKIESFFIVLFSLIGLGGIVMVIVNGFALIGIQSLKN